MKNPKKYLYFTQKLPRITIKKLSAEQVMTNDDLFVKKTTIMVALNPGYMLLRIALSRFQVDRKLLLRHALAMARHNWGVLIPPRLGDPPTLAPNKYIFLHLQSPPNPEWSHVALP